MCSYIPFQLVSLPVNLRSRDMSCERQCSSSSAQFVMCLQCRLLFSLRFIFISLSLNSLSHCQWHCLGFSFLQLFLFLYFPLGFFLSGFLFLLLSQLSVSLPYPVWPVCLSVRSPPASSLLTSQVLCKTNHDLSLFLCLYTSFLLPIPPTHIFTFEKEVHFSNVIIYSATPFQTCKFLVFLHKKFFSRIFPYNSDPFMTFIVLFVLFGAWQLSLDRRNLRNLISMEI